MAAAVMRISGRIVSGWYQPLVLTCGKKPPIVETLPKPATSPAVYVSDERLKSGVIVAVTVLFRPGPSVRDYVETEISDLVV